MKWGYEMTRTIKKLDKAKAKSDIAAAKTTATRKAAFADGSLAPKEERMIQRATRKQARAGAKVNKAQIAAEKKAPKK